MDTGLPKKLEDWSTIQVADFIRDNLDTTDEINKEFVVNKVLRSGIDGEIFESLSEKDYEDILHIQGKLEVRKLFLKVGRLKNSDLVTLNVNGVKYESTKSTLSLRSDYFKGMFNMREAGKNMVYINRNAQIFKTIWFYIHSHRQLLLLPSDPLEARLAIEEYQFFGFIEVILDIKLRLVDETYKGYCLLTEKHNDAELVKQAEERFPSVEHILDHIRNDTLFPKSIIESDDFEIKSFIPLENITCYIERIIPFDEDPDPNGVTYFINAPAAGYAVRKKKSGETKISLMLFENVLTADGHRHIAMCPLEKFISYVDSLRSVDDQFTYKIQLKKRETVWKIHGNSSVDCFSSQTALAGMAATLHDHSEPDMVYEPANYCNIDWLKFRRGQENGQYKIAAELESDLNGYATYKMG